MEFLPQVVSDSCSTLVRFHILPAFPLKPFKNFWITHSTYNLFIIKPWNQINEGVPMSVGVRMKILNKQFYSDITDRIAEAN